ncbi:MAG: hypothetical protein IPL49_09125 [Saprospirales bacterium]|nr:hypothetical protein [Saprospirales bacterium]MBK8491034.1 hypothetical protein [Saprospirales bacterium]
MDFKKISTLISTVLLGTLVLFSLIFEAGCYYDVEEELYSDTGCDTSNVTYSGVILPLLQDNCYICHNAASQFGGIILEGYDQVVTHVASGELLGAIKQEAGFTPMPLNQAKLQECVIAKVEAWINNGALNN